MKNKLSYKILGVLAFFAISTGTAYSIAKAPLFLTVKTDPNVLFNMSVEAPMGGAAYTDAVNNKGCTGRVDYPEEGNNEVDGQVGVCYLPTNTYVGYFNPEKCYKWKKFGTPKKHFRPVGNTNANHECSGDFSGNFLNWATMTAMDEFVYATTGGNRVVDNANTIVRRVRKTHDALYFPVKRVSLNPIPAVGNGAYGVNVAPNTVTPWNVPELFIFNTNYGVRFATKPWSAIGPGSYKGDSFRGDLYLTGGTIPNGKGTVKGKGPVRIALCFHPHEEANCVAQSNGSVKPYGLIQDNMENMRFGVMSYSNSDGDTQDGGVLRSNIKYVGPLMPDGSGGTIANPLAELDAADGRIELNANPIDAANSNVLFSGVISYLNKFSEAGYMEVDPASELFYESTRYYRAIGPTGGSYDGGDPGDFPIVTAAEWRDPIISECQSNFIIGINDPYPWYDKRVPGTYFKNSANWPNSNAADFGEPVNDPVLSVAGTTTTDFTNMVGDHEGLNNSVQRVGCVPGNCDHDANNPKQITLLGQVMGTAVNKTNVLDYPDLGEQENTYYLAGLAYYLNTVDIRSNIPGKQTVSTFMIDSQEYDPFGKPTSSSLNLLWLTGKYGGFDDVNGDGVPQKDEWDSYPPANPSATPPTPKGDNEPDNYVLVSDPQKMIDGLKRAFSVVKSSSADVSSVSANSTRISADSYIFQAKLDPADWSSSFKAFALNTDGSVATVETWNAEDHFATTSRKFFSYDAVTQNGIDFDYGNLALPDQALLKSNAIVEYIKGSRADEGTGAGNLRIRNRLLGAIIQSNPWYVGDDENFGYSQLPTGGPAYSQFVKEKEQEPAVVYVASNEGLLHGFSAETGKELLAYAPAAAFPKLARTTLQNYGCATLSCEKFEYLHDGSAKVGDVFYGGDWHRVLVNTLGAGGSGVYALDVTKPTAFTKTDVLWEATNKTIGYEHLGEFIPQASVVNLEGMGPVAIVANGYGSTLHKAVLYVIDIETGQPLATLNTNAGSAANINGLSQPYVVDMDRDGIADAIYAGDLLGNMWKFGLKGGSWKVLGKSGGQPLFIAEDATGTPQPITSPPVVGLHPTAGLMVYFGTGRYFNDNDQVVTPASQVNTFYGVLDSDPTGNFSTYKRNQLVAQTILQEVSLTVPLLDFRITSDNAVDYSLANVNGWFMDLRPPPPKDVEGERVVFSPVLRQNRIVFVTLIPSPDPCAAGGSSWFMELDPLTGARLINFDTDGDGVFTDADYSTLFPDVNGKPTPYTSVGGRRIDHISPSPVIVTGTDQNGKGVEHSYFPGGVKFDSEAPPSGQGRQTWRQLQ